MPWEADGRRWHTRDRVGRNGQPCRWDGRILAAVVDRIHELGEFSDTNWNARTVVEIAAARKSDGWFFHAITGEQWLLKLKFRVAKNTFQRDDLVAQLDLKPLNDLPDLPVYGREPRVKCKNLRGPWQEVQLAVHSLGRRSTGRRSGSFWTAAVEGFQEVHRARRSRSPRTSCPGRCWGRNGTCRARAFRRARRSIGKPKCWKNCASCWPKRPRRDSSCGTISRWCISVSTGQGEPWATIYTKRPAGLDLVLTGPKNQFALGRVAEPGPRPRTADRPARQGRGEAQVPRGRRSQPRGVGRVFT